MISTQVSVYGPTDKREMQGALFAELSVMFSREVPMYTHALAVNAVCNRVVCDLLSMRFRGFSVSDAEIEYASGERHGAIRIGRADEYRWVARFFACFDMYPHNFYDMTSIGAKSQPVIATAFRSTLNPDHRVFTSLLLTEAFDVETRSEIEDLLSKRSVFSDRAKALIEQSETQGGLGREDADELIAEATGSIFKWRGTASGPDLYRRLCDMGYKIAADIACFHSHHLNHLTPNTLCMDLYTACMRHVLGELEADSFERLAMRAVQAMLGWMDHDALRLHFKHFSEDRFGLGSIEEVSDDSIAACVTRLVDGLEPIRAEVSALEHNGFKDRTEGPPANKQVLLRQDAYRALREPVEFVDEWGETQTIHHTARFGEIEQRYYATTPKGRALYDSCLEAYEESVASSQASGKIGADQLEALQRAAFEPFPLTLGALAAEGLVYVRYVPLDAAQGCAPIDCSPGALLDLGLIRAEGLRYEDFLPASAAGIFASNLDQYGIDARLQGDASSLQSRLEDIIGRAVIDSDRVYSGIEAASLLDCYEQLGMLDHVPQEELAALRSRAAAAIPPAEHGRLFGGSGVAGD